MEDIENIIHSCGFYKGKAKDIKGIAYNAFDSSQKIVAVNVDAENPYLTSEDGILYNKDKTALFVYF